ncbi:MAG: thioredoxin family protein [Bacteroidota bacterium]
MKKLFLLSILTIFSAVSLYAQHEKGGLIWYTSLEQANALSQSKHKPIFAFFTGSDWCGWCHKLEADVFSKPAFITWAKKNVILLELDFPRQKQLSPELQQQNGSLQQAFRVQGYPTIWYFTMRLDSASKKSLIDPLGSQGYPAGSEPGQEVVKFLGEANTIVAKGKMAKTK